MHTRNTVKAYQISSHCIPVRGATPVAHLSYQQPYRDVAKTLIHQECSRRALLEKGERKNHEHLRGGGRFLDFQFLTTDYGLAKEF
jgi:hypothetical protein